LNLRTKIILGAIFLLSGCANNTMYYWGNYSNSLYQYKKNLTQESLDRHISELLEIVRKSNARNLRVPPGVYAELGFIYTEKGDNVEAIKYFELEKNTYPESAKFMDSLIKSMG